MEGFLIFLEQLRQTVMEKKAYMCSTGEKKVWKTNINTHPYPLWISKFSIIKNHKFIEFFFPSDIFSKNKWFNGIFSLPTNTYMCATDAYV